MTTRLYTGESRTIEFSVTDSKDEEFTIGEAYYTVMLGSEVVDSGLMDVEGHTMTMRLSPTRAGLHTIQLKYVVGSDIMKDRYLVEVVEG